MAYLEPVERPIFYAAVGVISGIDIAENGETRLGDATGIANVLAVYSDTDENVFIGQLPATVWSPLPDVGEWLEQSAIYEYDGKALMVRQSHNRTIYPPAETPALFIVHREDADDALETQ